MTRVKPEHWLLENMPQDKYNSIFNTVDLRLIYDSLYEFCKIEDVISNSGAEKDDDLVKMTDLLEMTTIDLLNNDETKSIQCKKAFQDLFYLTKVLPIPVNEIEKIKYIYKLVSYSYLGERWESGRRFLIENIDKCKVKIFESDEWDVKVFKTTYLAFLYLIKKDNWEDLHKASQFIQDLREDQLKYEKQYLSFEDTKHLKGRAYELVGLYHFAKSIELMASFMVNGEPYEIREQIDFHFEKAIEATEQTSNVEMNLLMQILKNTIKQMISNSVWMVTQRVNSRVTKFVRNVTKSNRPIFELLYPQRYAVLERGLLDPAHKAVVVNMPTSSGKTLLAEFRILQALNQFAEDNGWIVYVAPTRALVNQVTARLKRDLEPINIKVEKLSGAVEIDSFEENLLVSNTKMFDVLVTTPEKLNLLIRDNIEKKIQRPMALAVIDEAHNIEDSARGLNLELLMSNIKNDCPRANFLLLTPFIPNSEEFARWLDPDSPNSIQLQLSWKPNDRIIGAFYPEGSGRQWTTTFETMITSDEQIQIEKQIKIDYTTPLNTARSGLTKTKLAAAVTKQLIKRKGILTICKDPKLCWECARLISNEIESCDSDEDINFVKRFIASELGEDFILIRLLDKGIGVHHSGLPDEVRFLMEWLMEKEKLRVLVATTTIAQGINFPVSTILMGSYSYPFMSEMPLRDFWNLVGRAGRTDQGSLGVVGIALGDEESKKASEIVKLKRYLLKATENLISNLVQMMDEALKLNKDLNLSTQYFKPEWSQFMQYITHMFNQCEQLSEFNTKAELFLRRTYGYGSLSTQNKRVLLEAVKSYGESLNKHKGLAKLSDSTGFSMEAINQTMKKIKDLRLDYKSWEGSNLFSSNGKLKNLMGVMLTIPEISKSLQEIAGNNRLSGDTLASITVDWVSGKDIEYIAKTYFGEDMQDSVTKCCNAIYSKLINSATWGLASIQKIPNSGLDFDQLPEEEKRRLSNLPAMIYYGVGSNEAILMRMNSVPRSIAQNLGGKFIQETKNILESTPIVAYEWISKLADNDWDKFVGKNKSATGKDYSRVWRILNGAE